MEYRDFKCWVERRDEYKDVPSPVLPSMLILAKAICCLGFFLVMGEFFPPEFTWSPEYTESSFLYRFFYLNMTFYGYRYFYYLGFVMQEGTAIASGLGYNGKSLEKGGHDLWDKIIGI